MFSSFFCYSISLRKFFFATDQTVSTLLKLLECGGWNTGMNKAFRSFIVAVVL